MTYYGFNFQWMYHPELGKKPHPADERALDFMAEHGFNFVRIPTNYWFWTTNFDYYHPQEEVLAYLDHYLQACQSRGLHLCLNLHRAPGYCINGAELEKHNLWQDQEAQDAFIFLWQHFAERYKGVSSQWLSFDLVNEPPEIGQYGLTRENHAQLIRQTTAAIWAIDPGRELVIDGLAGGNLAMPELADLPVIQSGRGYQPMPVSHYQASWWSGHAGLPEPVYPGTTWDKQQWNKETLRQFYQPWRDLQAQGVRVHIGEFGCYNHTPNEVALAWFADLLSLFQQFGWGYSLWEFNGAFGIANHNRPGVKYETYHGYQVDRALLDLFLAHRV